MRIQTFTVGRLATNCYVVGASGDASEAIIIDPGFDSAFEEEQIVHYIDGEKLAVKFIVNTHGHSDHIYGNNTLRKKYRAPLCIHEFDETLLILEAKGVKVDRLLRDGDIVKFGDATLKVLLTPGHTPGSICLVGDKVVFTGDTLFAGGIGRTDFPGGSNRDMKLSLEKLMGLPDNLVVYPGHGPFSTIGEERQVNPFLGWL